MKKSKTINKNNFVFSARHKEPVNKLPSETVKGMAYTIPQLFARFAAGDVTVGRNQGYYPDEDPDFDDYDLGAIARLDIEERNAVMAEVTEAMDRYKSALDAAKKAADKKQKDQQEASKKAAEKNAAQQSDKSSEKGASNDPE